MMGIGLFRKGMQTVMWWASAYEVGFLALGKKCILAQSTAYFSLVRMILIAHLMILVAATLGLAFLKLELAVLFAASQIGVLSVPMILTIRRRRSALEQYLSETLGKLDGYTFSIVREPEDW